MDYSSIMTFAGSLVTIGTAITLVQKVLKNFKKAREEYNAKLLQAAKEEISVTRLKLESRIKDVESELETLRLTVNKDMEHVKETYSNEIKNLGEKIEEVRSELRYQHTQILQLLTKMVDDRK